MYSKQQHMDFSAASLSTANQQALMQNLNQRMEEFLGRVRSLEAENVMLEQQIKEWKKNEPVKKNYSKYEEEIEVLLDMVCKKTLENAQLACYFENAQIEAKDYQNRYAAEHRWYTILQERIEILCKTKNELEHYSSELRNSAAMKKEELACLSLDHNEAVQALQQSALPLVNIHVATVEDGSSMELSQLLNDIRTHYEQFITSNRIGDNLLNRAQLEEEANLRLSKEEEALKMAKAELNEARRQWQSLQVEIESLYALEKGLKNSLQATEDHYKAELQGLAVIIKELEEELRDVRQNIEKQLNEHQALLNTNMRLEQEITRYRRILEKEENRLSNTPDGTCKQNTFEVEEDLKPTVSEKHVLSGSAPETSLEKSIETVKTEEVVNGHIVKESAEAHGTIRAEKLDAVIRKWEDSFFKDHPRLRKKSVSLRFDLHMATSDENCAQKNEDNLPNIEVRLVMKRSQSIPSINP